MSKLKFVFNPKSKVRNPPDADMVEAVIMSAIDDPDYSITGEGEGLQVEIHSKHPAGDIALLENNLEDLGMACAD
jgi:hypothetical protein